MTPIYSALEEIKQNCHTVMRYKVNVCCRLWRVQYTVLFIVYCSLGIVQYSTVHVSLYPVLLPNTLKSTVFSNNTGYTRTIPIPQGVQYTVLYTQERYWILGKIWKSFQCITDIKVFSKRNRLAIYWTLAYHTVLYVCYIDVTVGDVNLIYY